MGVAAEMITGANIMGGNGQHERVKHDYYATPPEATEKLLGLHKFRGTNILEPCVGAGHIAEVLKRHWPEAKMTCLDLIDRGYPGTILTDFLAWNDPAAYDTIITNPPFALATEFIYKCMDLLADGGQLAMFLKIQFLEGVNRAELFDRYPPKEVYVFRKRISAWNNGQSINPDTGRPWLSTVCFAWYVWEKSSRSEPVIRWID